ncbi:MAG: alpha/beta fold hydrolase [Bdellovibrionales bacterium]|nr:alpha/beta fold hydrolase [Bdellovibrionales bacterium]
MLWVGLHGFGGQGEDLRPLFSSVVAENSSDSVWLPDLFLPGPLSPETDLAAWIDHFVKEIRIRAQGEPVQAIGYSLGGRLLLHILVNHPELFSAAVLVSSHPGITNSEEVRSRHLWEFQWAEKFRSLPWDQLWQEWNQNQVLQGSTANSHLPESEQARQLLAQSLIEWSPTRHQFAEAQIRGLPVPVLWLAGQRDRKYVQLYEGLKAQNVIQHLAFIPGAGHRAHLDQPDQVAKVVSDFFHA